MLFSLALIFILGILLGEIFKKLKLPNLIGMLLTGIILGPYALNLIDNSILSISADLRKIALIIILTRAGLSLNIEDLKKVGRPAILMCFIPACFEMLGMIILAPKFLGISMLDAAIMGAVVGAVSPAVIIPKMLKLMKENYGTKKSIPQLILAGASVDDIFVIVIFTILTGLAQGETITASSFLQIPISILTGALVGIITGLVLVKLFRKTHLRDSLKTIIILGIAFILVTIEDSFTTIIPFSGLLAIMALAITIQKKHLVLANRLSSKFSKLWVGAEILLFVLVGATVNLKYAFAAGFSAIILVFGVLLFRLLGVFLCLLKTHLNMKERLFCMIAYMPKATVQAAIGGIPLAMGLSSGEIILTVAVLSILITAPLGALGIDLTYKKLLTKD
ncbi:cation:proton antiporter [Miniphocaeibacter halophilus]|uniref:Cation:proton antiporter n=1 Tax=Miniphocaeibacter halophilus TaxID=2931922 RepID=A0AC61MS48_9FIRM|nr:cation:proton antiporter [Miniphocaeibacter halophilus]QQK08422.1 cation:proton antiporter [Miniphocaeibacter halophilus]